MSESDRNRLGDLIEGARSTPEYAAERALLGFLDALVERMDDLGLRRSDLADRMGVSRPMVTKLLRGDGNLTLHTMTNAALAVGCEIELALVVRDCDTFAGSRAACTPPAVPASV